MPVDKDPEVFKLLVGIVGSLIVIVGGLIMKMIYGLKETINTIFHRLNSTDHRVTKMEATCEERHNKRK